MRKSPPFQIAMNERHFLLIRILSKMRLVLSYAEQLLHRAVWTTRQDHVVDRKTHFTSHTERISRFQISDIGREGNRLRVLNAVEVGIEQDRKFTEYTHYVSAVRR